jgi:magnesium-transporting ATPase (P-type)
VSTIARATLGARAPAAGGLTAAEAAARLARDGPNRLPAPGRVPAWRRLAAEMFHFFALLFWVAGGLAFVAGMPQLGVAVFVVVVLNALFAFVQEERAEHAAERLRDLLPRFVTVVRDGVPVPVPAADVVVGDAVVLREGDRVSADLRLDTVHALALDTSTLTGESVPAHPDVGDAAWAGCFVVEGEADATVVATGSSTRLAGIASLTRARRRPPSPLHRELVRVSRVIAAVAIATGLGFFVLAVVVGMPPSDGFLFAVGVTVAVVPCGLLPTVTLSLAVGAQRMAARHALVRRLEAVETLGSTTFICTDKTGTLTRNEMSVVEVWLPAGRAEMAAFTAVLVASGWRPGDSFPGGATLLAASGAAFTAVVLGQAANAFACRSSVLPPWRLPRPNGMLVGAVAAELAMLAGFLYIPPIAHLLDQAPPTPVGFAVAILAVPAVLAADALSKAATTSRGRPGRDLRPYGATPVPADNQGVRERPGVPRCMSCPLPGAVELTEVS